MEETTSLQYVSESEMENSKGLTFASPPQVSPSNINFSAKHPSEVVKKKSREKKTLKSIAHTFCTVTSAHGWGRVALGINVKVKVLWLLLTAIALFMNIGHITILVSQYLAYDYEQVSEVHVSELQYPSITVCNIQPLSLTSTQKLMQNTSSKLFQWDNITKIFFPEETLSDMDDFLNYEILYNRVRQPTGFFENIGDEAVIIGHQPMDFLLSCTFGTTRCNFDNFTYFQSPEYYNCYTFNGGNTSREKVVVKSTGPQNGLSLIMYLESDNGDFLYNGTYYTFGNVANAAGVRVTIHAPDTRPSPSDLGFDVPPGYSSSVGVRAVKHRRLDEPYGACRKSTEWELGAGQYIYSTHSCLSQCQQQYVMDMCRCISAQLPVPPDAAAQGMDYCGHFNPEVPQTFYDNLSCEFNVTLAFASNQKIKNGCGCEMPCTEYEYESKTSYSLWPIDYTQRSFYQTYVANHKHAEQLKAYQNLGKFNLTEIIFYGLIRKNFVRLNVYLESLVMLEYVQKESYSFYNLWSDIGGTFGLWIGMSILTWLEVVELFMTLIYNAVQNKKE